MVARQMETNNRVPPKMKDKHQPIPQILSKMVVTFPNTVDKIVFAR